MANVTAADVKKLRDQTGAGMMDCKKALIDAEGDFAKAERILKELGKAAAAKRSGRATNEGRVFIAVDGDSAGIVELACETDFVARNETFVELGAELAKEVVARGINDADDELNAKVADAISTIKENMSIRRVALVKKEANETFASYIHGDAGRIGAIVKVATADASLAGSDRVKEFAFDCALHAVAFRPTYLTANDVEPAYKKEQEEIFTTQALNMGKPEKVVQGIVQGKLRKHLAEICFTEQGFVKDEKTSVANVAKEVGKEIGSDVTITGYSVFAVGE